MEIDQLKSAAEDQLEMMMLQMDKFPEFYGSYNDVVQLHPTDNFSTSIANSPPHFADTNNNNPQTDSPNFLNPPSTISFSNATAVQAPSIPDFLCNLTNDRYWRSSGGTGDLSATTEGTNSYLTPSQKRNSMAAMRETIFRIAAMQPIHIDPESVKPPKRRNVKISKDPQSVAARHRRERISERIRILQRLVPGGTKMDTASMLDEAIHYVKFLKTQVQSLERAAANRPTGIGFPVPMSSGSYLAMGKAYQPALHQNVEHYGDA